MSTNNQRIDLPQIDDAQDFRQWLISVGVHSHQELVPPSRHLKPTQLHPDDFDPRRFAFPDLLRPIIITADDFIVDGHHRVAASHHWDVLLPALRLSRPYDTDLLNVLKTYPGVHFASR